MRKNTFSTASFTVKLAALPLFALLVLLFASCTPDPTDEEDVLITEITISGIPASFPREDEPTDMLTTYKVYLNASDFDDHTKPPAAKGVSRILDATTKQADNTHTVTIQLQNPNDAKNKDPNVDTGNWIGTARYFSVVLSPAQTTKYEKDGYAVNAIWIKGGLGLSRDKRNTKWENGQLTVDFRNPPDLSGIGVSNQDFPEKARALYRDIIKEDKKDLNQPTP